jgi:hypothetical protein
MRRWLVVPLWGVSAIVLAACERSQLLPVQPSHPMATRSTDAAFRLTAEQRAKLIPNIDVDALERLLQRTSSAERTFLLHMFTQPEPGESYRIMGNHGGDATTNALLDEIWAPTWVALGAEAIENSDSKLPGRELARARLGLKRKSSAPQE